MSNIDRRTLLKLAGLIGVTAAMPFSFARAADNPLVVGFIYVGARDDFGYNQAHAEAAAIIKTLPNVVVAGGVERAGPGAGADAAALTSAQAADAAHANALVWLENANKEGKGKDKK